MRDNPIRYGVNASFTMAYMESRRHIATLAQIVLENNSPPIIIRDPMGRELIKLKTFGEVAQILTKENARYVNLRHGLRGWKKKKPHINIQPEEAVQVNIYQAISVLQGYMCQVAEFDDWELSITGRLYEWSLQNLIERIMEQQNVGQEYHRL